MADQNYTGPPITPQPSPEDGIHGYGVSDVQLMNNPVLITSIDGNPRFTLKGYAPKSVLDMAYGANDPSIMATQLMQSGEVFRLQRGYPYKRFGHMVPVFPQFKSQSITMQNLASQPQANSSVQQITQPTPDATTTVANIGSTPTIGYPGALELSLT